MTDPRTPIPEDMSLAAEYALGLLEGPARVAFEARLRTEKPLRRMVAQWQSEFAELTGDIDSVEPPASVKTALMAGLTPPRRKLGVWGWLGSTLVGGALAASLVMLVFVPPAPDFVAVYEAVLQAEDSALRIEASLSEDGTQLRVQRVAGAPPADRVLELWVIAGEAAPVSLGVLGAGVGETELPPALRGQIAGLVLAVSDEPPGGSPTGAPTGNVLAVAQINAL